MTIHLQRAKAILDILDGLRSGATRTELCDALGLNNKTAQTTFAALVKSGEMIRLGKPGSHTCRYCVQRHKDAAMSYMQNGGKAYQVKDVQVPAAEKPVNTVRLRGQRWDVNTPVDYRNIKPQVCKAGKDMRHTFQGTPGNHVNPAECRPWVTAALGS